MSADTMRTLAVIPTIGPAERLERCLSSIAAQTLPFARVMVVNDGGPEAPLCALAASGDVELVSLGHRRGFAGAVNAGIRRALEDPAVTAVALINDDVRLDPQWHEAGAAALARQPAEVGSCATVVVQGRDPRRVDSTGIEWRLGAIADNRDHGGEPPAVAAAVEEVWGASASAALYLTSLFRHVGLFDESFTAYQEDVELALRARSQGWRSILAPAARAEHDGFGSNRAFAGGGTWADFYNARNRITLLLTTLPGSEWRRQWRSILALHLRTVLRAVGEKRMSAVWLGAAHALWRAPASLGRRPRILRRVLPPRPSKAVSGR